MYHISLFPQLQLQKPTPLYPHNSSHKLWAITSPLYFILSPSASCRELNGIKEWPMLPFGRFNLRAKNGDEILATINQSCCSRFGNSKANTKENSGIGGYILDKFINTLKFFQPIDCGSI